jgi:hypothetical protein
VAWIIDWDLILEYAVGATMVAIGRSAYVVSVTGDFGMIIPAQFASAPLSHDADQHAWSSTSAILNVRAAVVVMVATTWLLVIGIRESARINDIIVAFPLPRFYRANFSTANWVTPGNPDGLFVQPNAGTGIYGWSGVVRGAAVVLFAYIGFDAVSATAQEAKRHGRDLPIGILGSLVICTILHRRRLRADGHRAVRQIERAGSDRGRHRRRRHRLAGAAGQTRDRARPDLRHLGFAAWSTPASSALWRMTACCRIPRPKSIRASRRHMFRPSAPRGRACRPPADRPSSAILKFESYYAAFSSL